MNYQNRQEIDNKYKWDLSPIFFNDEAWEASVKELPAKVEKVTQYEGRLLESKETLKEALESYQEATRHLGKIYMYAHLNYDLDQKNATYQDMNTRAGSIASEFNQKTSFIVPEILAADEKEVEQLLTGEMEIYQQYIDNILRKKEHTLSLKEEALLAGMGEINATPGTVFSLLNNADMELPEIKDEEGNTRRLTHGNFINFLQSKDQRVRKDAFEAMYSVFKGHRNTLAGLLQAQVKTNIFNARARNYPSARAASLANNNIPESVYDALIEAVHDALPAMHKYYSIRKRVLGLEEQHIYDTYVPLVENADMKVPFDEAKDYVIKSMKPLGEDYKKMLEESFESRWIDVYETPGKRSGAYSSGNFDTPPYMLLNYQDNLNNLFTLTHELGHSLHSYHSKLKQPYLYARYGIFLAEIASTFNEALLNDYLMKTLEDEALKKYILNHQIDGFKATLFRQTMFAEFERDIHKLVEEGGSLTSELLNQMYGELNEKYFGPDVIIDEDIEFEWSRIPHFYYNFYVFQYATGISASTSFAKRVLDGDEGAVEDYLGFLSAGSSRYPMDVLKDAGLDMTDPQAIKSALNYFSSLVDEFDNLV